MMNNEFELLNSGEWLYAGADNMPQAAQMLVRCADMCHELNTLHPSLRKERESIFRKLFGSLGTHFVIHSPFRCDFGFNIHIGENFIGNFNLSILDEARVEIGNDVMIGPNCSLITITHALVAEQRSVGIMSAAPVTIGNNVWLASNVVVLPGVKIGDGAIIGAGSVVTRSIPARMLAYGNPCRPRREVTDADRVSPMML